MDGIIKIWDANTGKLVMNLDGPTEINVNIFFSYIEIYTYNIIIFIILIKKKKKKKII